MITLDLRKDLKYLLLMLLFITASNTHAESDFHDHTRSQPLLSTGQDLFIFAS